MEYAINSSYQIHFSTLQSTWYRINPLSQFPHTTSEDLIYNSFKSKMNHTEQQLVVKNTVNCNVLCNTVISEYK